ncbi:hypothetical protein D3C79_1022900 [compost metagenome]
MKEINIAAGMEYWYDQQFAFRAGYFYESPQKGNRRYFTLGAGLKYNIFNIDIAYFSADIDILFCGWSLENPNSPDRLYNRSLYCPFYR